MRPSVSAFFFYDGKLAWSKGIGPKIRSEVALSRSLEAQPGEFGQRVGAGGTPAVGPVGPPARRWQPDRACSPHGLKPRRPERLQVDQFQSLTPLKRTL